MGGPYYATQERVGKLHIHLKIWLISYTLHDMISKWVNYCSVTCCCITLLHFLLYWKCTLVVISDIKERLGLILVSHHKKMKGKHCAHATELAHMNKNKHWRTMVYVLNWLMRLRLPEHKKVSWTVLKNVPSTNSDQVTKRQDVLMRDDINEL